MGIGGGHFMIIYVKSTNKSYFIDARDVAPLSAYKDMFAGRNERSLYGKRKIIKFGQYIFLFKFFL